MKITSVQIGSFGNRKDMKAIEFDPGMNLIFGENESGKTTIMEFIRGTLSPVKTRKTYPLQDKNDHGTVSVMMDDGSKKILKREDKKSSEIDPILYRNIYAMTPEDLRDSNIISSGEIKSKFLTVPGGDRLPEIIESINEEMSEMLTPGRRSDNKKIGRVLADLKEIDYKSNTGYDTNKYDGLFEEHSKVEDDLKELRSRDTDYEEKRNSAAINRSQKDNLETLKNLRLQAQDLSIPRNISDDEISRYYDQKNDVRDGSLRYRDANDRFLELSKNFLNIDPMNVLKNELRINNLENNIGQMDFLERTQYSLTSKSNIVTTPASIPRRKNNIIGYALVVLGIMLIAAGFIINTIFLPVGSVLILIGIYLALQKLHNDDIPSHHNNDLSELESVNKKIDQLNNELTDLTSRLDVERTSSFKHDVSMLSTLLERSRRYQESETASKTAEIDMKDALTDLQYFLSEFGGEEKFLETVSKQKKKVTLDEQIRILENSIAQSGYDPDLVLSDDIPENSEMLTKISELSRRSGELRREMKAILDDDERERLMDKRAELRSELGELVKRWGMLSIASNIVDSSCNELYSTMQPIVITTADRYIKTMTDDRYGLNMDPRNSDISVVSGNDNKAEGQWSSGLGDQIKLSIKLAVAKELSEEKMPVMLDDVLLTFDSKRKKGGCKTLIEASKDMQILLFTCDRETRDLMIEEGCKTLIEL
jgi:Uncharacterized conserved protein